MSSRKSGIVLLENRIYWLLLGQEKTGERSESVDANHCIEKNCPCGGTNSHVCHNWMTYLKLWQEVFLPEEYGVIDPAVRRSLERSLESDFPEWTLESFTYDSRLHMFRLSFVPK
jgi:hypothetical protein